MSRNRNWSQLGGCLAFLLVVGAIIFIPIAAVSTHGFGGFLWILFFIAFPAIASMAVLGFIPIVGPLVWWFTMRPILFSSLESASIDQSWFTASIIWFSFLCTIAINLIATIFFVPLLIFGIRTNGRYTRFCEKITPAVFDKWDISALNKVAGQSLERALESPAGEDLRDLFRRGQTTLGGIQYENQKPSIKFRRNRTQKEPGENGKCIAAYDIQFERGVAVVTWILQHDPRNNSSPEYDGVSVVGLEIESNHIQGRLISDYDPPKIFPDRGPELTEDCQDCGGKGTVSAVVRERIPNTRRYLYKFVCSNKNCRQQSWQREIDASELSL